MHFMSPTLELWKNQPLLLPTFPPEPLIDVVYVDGAPVQVMKLEQSLVALPGRTSKDGSVHPRFRRTHVPLLHGADARQGPRRGLRLGRRIQIEA